MKRDLINKLRSSLFLKILLIFVGANFAIIGVAALADEIILDPARFSKKKKSNVGYSHYIMKDLGSPPDTAYARQVADSLGIQIRFKGEDFTWVSHEGIIDFDDLQLREYRGNRRIRAGYQDGVGSCVDIQTESARYLFVLRSDTELTYAYALYNGLVLVIATLSIISLYFLMRSLLQPVKKLHAGVQQISSGNLDYEIPTKAQDELGALVKSFNSMTKRIKGMIKAREQLLLDVSHELRSPLTRVKVALEFLQDGKAKKNITDDVLEMETMITEILESQRLSSPHGYLNVQSTNISNLLKEVCQDLAGRRPGVELTELPDDLVLEVDPHRTKILFKNVIANAIKYSEANDPPVKISLQPCNGEVVVGVQDFGSGIPEEDLPYIFEPFYRVDKSRSKDTGGYGLGMNLSKKIMEAHGGRIEVKSTLNVGTTVYLSFKFDSENSIQSRTDKR